MTTSVSAFAGITKPGITMLNRSNTSTTNVSRPSVRPEIEIHSIEYTFELHKIRKGDGASKTVMPTKPASTLDASSHQGLTTAPSYKTPLSPPAAQDRQQSAIASKIRATLSTKPTSLCTAKTFVSAARSGCLDSVVQHIDAGLEVNIGAKRYGSTPLIMAAAHGHEAIVRRLLEHGAYVNKARADGTTALMFAAQNGHTATVHALLVKSTALDQADAFGRTALMIAAMK